MTDNTRPMRILLPVTFALLAGCGQSGDLYLPPKEQTAPPPPVEQPPPTQVEQKKDKK
jgi:predicted small lipoprotein YifL